MDVYDHPLARRLSWKSRLDAATQELRRTSPQTVRLRVFGRPSRTEARIAEATVLLLEEGYGFKTANQLAMNPFIMVTDLYFERQG